MNILIAKSTMKYASLKISAINKDKFLDTVFNLFIEGYIAYDYVSSRFISFRFIKDGAVTKYHVKFIDPP